MDCLRYMVDVWVFVLALVWTAYKLKIDRNDTIYFKVVRVCAATLLERVQEPSGARNKIVECYVMFVIFLYKFGTKLAHAAPYFRCN